MQKINGMRLFSIFLIVLISGCDNKQVATNNGIRDMSTSYDLEPAKTAWLRDHLPNETLAYINVPTPWNYLFDAKADALHAVQSLPAHKQQVADIKQGIKDNYYQFVPVEAQGVVSMLMEHVATSVEVALINYSESAMLPTVAIGTRLEGMTADQVADQLTQVLLVIDPNIELVRPNQDPQWTFKVNMFPAFVRFDQSTGRLLMFGGMGANNEKMNGLWEQTQPDQLTVIKQLGQQSDPSGLNLKMWMAPARMYQLGGAFVPAEQHAVISKLALDQMDYIWLGAESAEGQSALALHVLMPEAGWRLMLPRANDWFDVEVSGKPRSVVQLALPTADQIEQAISHFKLDEMVSEQTEKEFQEFFKFKQTFGFDIYDFFRAYHQQVYMVSDDSGSWWAMKIKDDALHQKLNKQIYDFYDIKPEGKMLNGAEVMQAHFSVYAKLLQSSPVKSAEADQIEAFLNMFKDHVYWYEEAGVFYMSTVPHILADKRNTGNPMKLSEWLNNNQGGHWESAIMAYGKDVKDMPQSLYHFYLLLLQGLGDLAQVEVDLYELPTAQELNLPDDGRINLVISSDAEKVSFKVGYEYSVIEGVLSAEGGMTTIAVIGILAAYAIPAYRDYEVRAQVGAELALASSVKIAVAEHWHTYQSFAGVQESLADNLLNYQVDEETGTIMIDLEGVGSAFEFGDYILLDPAVEAGYISWTCMSNIKESYLPASCRAN